MAKTRAQLRESARRIIGQTDSATSNVSDSMLNDFADEAVAMAVAKLKRGGTVDTETDYDMASGSTVTFNTTITAATSIRYKDGVTGKWYPLKIRTKQWIIDNYPDYENDDSGRPEYIFRDAGFNDVRVYPAPSSDHVGTNVIRVNSLEYPSTLSSDSSTPDLPEIIHLTLPHYMAYMAFSFLDEQEKAIRELTLFRSDLKSKAALIAKLGIRRHRWSFGGRSEGY